jgi:hypothetical protein
MVGAMLALDVLLLLALAVGFMLGYGVREIISRPNSPPTLCLVLSRNVDRRTVIPRSGP